MSMTGPEWDLRVKYLLVQDYLQKKSEVGRTKHAIEHIPAGYKEALRAILEALSCFKLRTVPC